MSHSKLSVLITAGLITACGESKPLQPQSKTSIAKPAHRPGDAGIAESPEVSIAIDASIILPSDFVDIAEEDSDILLDMRYASENNFAHKKVYPKARCLLRPPVAAALLRVQQRLREQEKQLLLWDCYRPFHVQELFWKLVPDPKYVARPLRNKGEPSRGSKHNRGAAIDLTLADATGSPLPMPTDHDDFSERAHRDARGIPANAAQNARLLEGAMQAEGFIGIDTEWWHFDYKGWQKYDLSDEPL